MDGRNSIAYQTQSEIIAFAAIGIVYRAAKPAPA